MILNIKNLFALVYAFQCLNFCIRNVHITLGDYFANRNSSIIYRVGFMTEVFGDHNCISKLKLVVTFPDNTTTLFTTNIVRNDEFHGISDMIETGKQDDRIYDIKRTYGFIALRHLTNPIGFHIISKSKVILSEDPLILKLEY